MGAFAIAMLVLLTAGALASWVVGALASARARAPDGNAGGASWLAAVAWPWGIAQLQKASPEQGAIVNKAIVAFFVCVTLAVTTISLSTNYNRLFH